MESEPLENAVHYHQGCPVCGRTLRIQVVLLGSRVYCQHCGGGFVASDASLRNDDGSASERTYARRTAREASRVDSLLQRAERLLEQTRS